MPRQHCLTPTYIMNSGTARIVAFAVPLCHAYLYAFDAAKTFMVTLLIYDTIAIIILFFFSYAAREHVTLMLFSPCRYYLLFTMAPCHARLFFSPCRHADVCDDATQARFVNIYSTSLFHTHVADATPPLMPRFRCCHY